MNKPSKFVIPASTSKTVRKRSVLHQVASSMIQNYKKNKSTKNTTSYTGRNDSFVKHFQNQKHWIPFLNFVMRITLQSFLAESKLAVAEY
jgi:hypothetical protein